MTKLLIEIEVTDPEFHQYDLDLFLIKSVIDRMREDRLDWKWSATVTNDQGEIIRESE